MLPFYRNPKPDVSITTVRHKKATKLGDSYCTPDWFYRALDVEFRFTLDPCPFDPDWSLERVSEGLSIDGLALDWTGHNLFINPPYSKIAPWVTKAVTSSALCVFLVPNRTDTEWWANLVQAGAEFRFLRKRIQFKNVEGKKCRPAESSVIAILRNKR